MRRNFVMEIERKFAWPSRFPTAKNKGRTTGSVGKMFRIAKGVVGDGRGWVDPMSGRSTLAEIRNDIREKGTEAIFHMDALEFLKGIGTATAPGVLYDPPYGDAQGKKYTKHHGRPYPYALVELEQLPRLRAQEYS